MAAVASAKQFLQALWGNNSGFAELTVINDKGVLLGAHPFQYSNSDPFTYESSIESLIDASTRHNQKNNVYMGLCLRREKWPRRSGKKEIDGSDEIEKRGTEPNALSSMVVWMDLDFTGSHHKGKTIDKDVARKLLKEFPLKPSIIVKSGGDSDSGIHVYWLLKEPAVGAELRTVKNTNKALIRYFAGADSVADLARVLRLPGSVNWNLEKPEKAYVSWWHPEWTYTFHDFEQYLQIRPAATEGFTLLPGGQSISLAPAPSLQTQSSDHEPRQTPTEPLDDQLCQMIAKLFSKIWFKGSRHEMALCISGWLAFAGVKFECAAKIVETAGALVGGETKLNEVRDTYTKFVQGGEVKGRPSLETYIETDFPEGEVRQFGKKTIEAIQKLLPRPKGSRKSTAVVDFKVLWLERYTSQPAVWTVTLEKDAQKLVTRSEHSRFMKYELFVEDVADQNRTMPVAGLKNPEWRAMINDAIRQGLYEEKEAPPQSRPGGAIEKGLEEFLTEAKENPDFGLLKKFPGYDEEATFFRLETLRSFLDEQGRKVTQNQLTERLKAMGWESKVRRFGKKTPHVWLKATVQGSGGNSGNGHGGNGNGGGHGPPQQPFPAATTPEPTSKGQPPPELPKDLFPATEEDA